MDLSAGFVRDDPGGCKLSVRVIPRSSREQVVGSEPGELKIKLKAPPVEGAANEALISFLASLLRRPKTSITIVSGQGSKHKIVHVAGLKAEAVLGMLGQ